MSLINCKVELKLKWTKYCFLYAASNDNDYDNDNDNKANNINFTIKDIKLSVSVVTLSARDNKKLSKLLSKGFERSIYWMSIKQKVRIKIRETNRDIFSNQILPKSLD